MKSLNEIRKELLDYAVEKNGFTLGWDAAALEVQKREREKAQILINGLLYNLKRWNGSQNVAEFIFKMIKDTELGLEQYIQSIKDAK
jgi:hypothetical protein